MNNIPLIPPSPKISQFWWVHRRDGDGRSQGLEMYQWQSGVQKWCRPNEYACGRDLDLIGYECVAICPTPAFPDEVREVKDICNRINREFISNPEAVIINREEWCKLKRMLAEQIPFKW